MIPALRIIGASLDQVGIGPRSDEIALLDTLLNFGVVVYGIIHLEEGRLGFVRWGTHKQQGAA